jgi:hypothetical protein
LDLREEEVVRGWRRLHNEELHKFYASLSINQGDQDKQHGMGGACSSHGRDENFIQFFYLKTWREETIQKTQV